MSGRKLACIILAAGQGTRMKSALPKALHPLAGRPMIGWLLESVRALKPERIVTVIGPGMEDLAEAVKPCRIAVQENRRGTGDAVRAALPALKGFSGDVLILLGDMPLISPATLRALVKSKGAGELSVLGAVYDPPPAFGRLVTRPDGTLEKIVEHRDCTPAQRKITLCNTGAFCADARRLAAWVPRLKNGNAQKEFYITDIAAMAREARVHIASDTDEVRGVNSRADLAVLEGAVQRRLRTKAMENGATLIDPDTVYFSWDTALGRDVTVEPGVFFGPGVTAGDGAHIKAYSHLEGARIGPGCDVGPFARLRPGAKIGAGSRIGNFVEVKNAVLGEGVKAGHLAYIGDAEIGDGVNFSCGAITVNYDGADKHKTVVGAGAMVGSNVNLVAPVAVGKSAYIAAGSTITKDVPAGALAVARARAAVIEGWVEKKKKKKGRKGK